LRPKLWGDNFFDPKSKKWKKDGVDEEGKPLRRAFAQFIMDPICKLCTAVMEGNKDAVEKMLVTIDIKLK
jgi:elongation factor 2